MVLIIQHLDLSKCAQRKHKLAHWIIRLDTGPYLRVTYTEFDLRSTTIYKWLHECGYSVNMKPVIKVAAPSPLNPIKFELARLEAEGIDLEQLSDLNIVRLFSKELRALQRGESPPLGNRGARRLHRMGLINIVGARLGKGTRRALTQRCLMLLEEVHGR